MFKRYYHILHHFVILNIWIYSAPYLLIPYWLIFKWSSGHVLKLARPPISFRQLIFQQPHEEDGLNWFFLLQDHPHRCVDIFILNSNTLPHFEHLNRASCLTHKSHTVICVWFCSIRAKYSCGSFFFCPQFVTLSSLFPFSDNKSDFWACPASSNCFCVVPFLYSQFFLLMISSPMHCKISCYWWDGIDYPCWLDF